MARRSLMWHNPNPRDMYECEICVQCPNENCDAPAGEYCRTKLGFGAGEPHQARWGQWRAAGCQRPSYTPYVPPEDIPLPGARLITIEVVMHPNAMVDEEDNVKGSIQYALEELQTHSAAEVVGNVLLEDGEGEATTILQNKRVEL